VISSSCVSLIMCTGGAYRPFLHDRHFNAASSFQIGYRAADGIERQADAAGSTVMHHRDFCGLQPLHVGFSARSIEPRDFVNHYPRSGFVYRPA
jgi:hypothetical protein